MESTLPAIEGLRLVGSGHARPSEVAPGRVPGRLTNAQVYERLLGPEWKAELQSRGLNWAKPRNAWGITAREWACTPGSEEAPGCSLVELAVAAGRAALAEAGWGAGQTVRVGLVTSAFGLDPTPEADAVAEAVAVALDGSSTSACVSQGAAPGGGGGLAGWIEHLRRNSAAGENDGSTSGARPESTRLLLIGVDLLSTTLDARDLALAMVHGDAAAALAVEVTEDKGPGLMGAGWGRLDGGPHRPTLEADADGHLRLRRPDDGQRASARSAWERAVAGIANLPSAAVFMPFAVTRDQVGAVAAHANYSPSRTKASIAEHGCTGAASIFLSMHDFLRDSERAGADLNVVNVDLVGAGAGGHWAWMRWNLGDGNEPDSALVPTDD